MKFLKTFIIYFVFNLSLCQITPYKAPLTKSIDIKNIVFYDIENIINQNLDIDCFIKENKSICQLGIKFDSTDLYSLDIILNDLLNNGDLFIINSHKQETFLGPYQISFNKIKTNPILSNSIILEINYSKKIESTSLKITNYSNPYKKINNDFKNKYFKKNNDRDEPIILLTGYWPPTNEMIRHFSQNNELNPNGWQGENWENRGYDIISYFPSFSDPDCSSCGQGYGDLEVDYQDTSEDFWPIFNSHNPIALITFSRGYMDQSWELEFNAYNRTNWINDFTSPFQPTPNPPDENENAFYLRNSNLPMNEIIESINNLNIGLNPYIDINGDPGHYVSEFMAYHGTWYRDLNQFNNSQNCIAAGHIHVGGNINWNNATIATEESIRTLINYIDSFIYTPGDLNQDDIIDILDLVTIVNFILGDLEFTNLQLFAADLNEDLIINIQDVILVINLILN